MSVLKNLLEGLPRTQISFETFDRTGEMTARVSGAELIAALHAHRPRFQGWTDQGRKVVALLFKAEETVDFLVAAFAALAEGFTIVPLYPNWPAETQLAYLRSYRLHSLAVGAGFKARAETWQGGQIERLIEVDQRRRGPAPAGASDAAIEPYYLDVPRGHPCAWIFTSGTSGTVAKLTEITRENLEAAIENIQALDFLRPGMTLHCPLSTSHIFAFVALLGFIAVKPRRVIFSDVQHLSRLPRERTGKVDGMILVPLVMNRMRAAFYERLTSRLDSRTVPEELKALARLPLPVRKVLKKVVLRAEAAVVDLETGRPTGPAGWAAIQLARRLFGRTFGDRLGSTDFVVVGGAKPNLQSMAFLEVLGIRCLQGWGMTETTGPLAVCRLGDRRSGAFGTCGKLFDRTRAYVEDGELIVEGPQIARGYHQPDGTFHPFHGKKRTGDHAEFDAQGRLKVLGKASDRITTENGINYNPIPFEEELHALDLHDRHLVEEVVVIGDAQPRLGAVFFLREGAPRDAATRAYLQVLVRTYNARHAVDETIGPWKLSEELFRDAGLLGPSGKLVRRRAEEKFAALFGVPVEVGG